MVGKRVSLGLDESCEVCRFWEPCQRVTGGGDLVASDCTLAPCGNSGECRRNAPARILADAPDALGECAKANGEYDEGGEWEQTRRVFPLTYCWDWCGAWEADGTPRAA